MKPALLIITHYRHGQGTKDAMQRLTVRAGEKGRGRAVCNLRGINNAGRNAAIDQIVGMAERLGYEVINESWLKR